MEQLRHKALMRYVREVLGLDFQLLDFGAANMPFFLRDRYAFSRAQLAGQECLLFMPKQRGTEPAPGILSRDAEKLRDQTQLIPIWVVSQISAYDRRRLIDQRVAFIVPGIQAYLPTLLIDLRERFQSSVPRKSSDHLSPATQAVLLNVIYNRISDLEGITAPKSFDRYTKMTLSRAMAELRQYDLVQTESEGRIKRGHFALSGRALWDKALPHLRNPARKTINVTAEELARIPQYQEAGLTALAHFSFLNPPPLRVYAYHQRFSAAGKNRGIFRPTQHAEDAAARIELWTYDPLPEALPRPTVDRLSLYLTLKDDPDERVQSAVEELLKGVF